MRKHTAHFPELDLLPVESGGHNLATTFRPELADLTIDVIDVARAEKIPRNHGFGITHSDLLVSSQNESPNYFSRLPMRALGSDALIRGSAVSWQ